MTENESRFFDEYRAQFGDAAVSVLIGLVESAALLAELANKLSGADDPKVSSFGKELRASHREEIDAKYAKNEARVCQIFDLTLISLFAKRFAPGIINVEREVRTPCGFIDRLITHEGGIRTVVEVKQRVARRDHACGIGQAIMYAQAVRNMPGVIDVRMALVVDGKPDPWVESACKSAGVEYVVIPDVVSKINDVLAECYENIVVTQ